EGLLFAALELGLVKSRPQHGPSRGPILVLRPLVLTLHHNAGRFVSHAHGAVGGVDVLTARPRSPICVDANVLFVDLDLDGVVDRWIDPHRGEAGVAAGIRIEWRYTHQAVHA